VEEKNAFLKRYPQVVRVMFESGSKGVFRELRDARLAVLGLWVEEGGGKKLLYVWMVGDMVPQYIMKFLFGLSVNEASLLDTQRVEFYAAPQAEIDIFTPLCSRCRRPLLMNFVGSADLYSKQSGNICLRCNAERKGNANVLQ
jgi:hypothetical protein